MFILEKSKFAQIKEENEVSCLKVKPCGTTLCAMCSHGKLLHVSMYLWNCCVWRCKNRIKFLWQRMQYMCHFVSEYFLLIVWPDKHRYLACSYWEQMKYVLLMIEEKKQWPSEFVCHFNKSINQLYFTMLNTWQLGYW
jgi:hypothetical protein